MTTESATDVRDATEIATIKEQLPVRRAAQAASYRPEAARHPGRLAGRLLRALKGQMTKALGLQDTTELHQQAQRRPRLGAARGRGQLVLRRGPRRASATPSTAVVLFFQELIAIPAFPRPVPEIGWLGRGRARGLGHLRRSPGCARRSWSPLTFLFFGVVDLWSDSMDTLIITLLAVVICMVVGIPLGIWMARSKAVSNAVTPVLDIMQTFPPFCYLAPLALFFGIGSACALVLTIIYALPPHRPDHRARHPLGLARPRMRRPGRWDSPVARCCVRCSCRWPAAPSSSASTSA